MVGQESLPLTARYQVCPATEFDQGAEDFQSSDMIPKTGTHVHEMTSDDIVTRFRSIELCRLVSLGARQFRHIRGTRGGTPSRLRLRAVSLREELPEVTAWRTWTA